MATGVRREEIRGHGNMGTQWQVISAQGGVEKAELLLAGDWQR